MPQFSAEASRRTVRVEPGSRQQAGFITRQVEEIWPGIQSPIDLCIPHGRVEEVTRVDLCLCRISKLNLLNRQLRAQVHFRLAILGDLEGQIEFERSILKDVIPRYSLWRQREFSIKRAIRRELHVIAG